MSFPATRLRRLRRTGALRDLVRETELARRPPRPAAVRHAGRATCREPIESMPGIERLSISERSRRRARSPRWASGPCCSSASPADKDERGSGAYDDEGVVQLAVRALKEAHPELVVITDVCLCEYTSHGHCGVVRPDGEVDNDLTLELLAKTAISHAAAGADAVAPSDMMDGRVGAIRSPARRGGPHATRRSSPTARSSPRPSTGPSARPPIRRRRSATGAATRWIPANARRGRARGAARRRGGRRRA